MSGKPLLRLEEMEANIRALRGLKVEQLQLMVAQRGGHEDVLHGLLKAEGGRWHRFFLDVGVLFWEELEALEPEDTEEDGATLRTLDVAGAELARVAVKALDEGARLTLTLVDGRTVVLQGLDEGAENERVTLTGP